MKTTLCLAFLVFGGLALAQPPPTEPVVIYPPNPDDGLPPTSPAPVCSVIDWLLGRCCSVREAAPVIFVSSPVGDLPRRFVVSHRRSQVLC